VFAAGKLSLSRVKLICSSNAVLAPAKASTRVQAVTVQKLRLAGAIVPVGLADGAVVVFPCKPQPQKSRRGARFQYSYVIIDDKEVPLKNSIWVTPLEKGAEPVITASQIDLTPMDQEKREAVSAAKKLKGTVFCVWRDGDLSHADLKAFVVRKDWDGFLVACGTYAKEVTYEPGILAEEAYMAVCLLGNYDGQLMQVLFGSYGTVDGALEDATLQVAANLCQRAKNLEALFDETTPLDLVRAARLSQQGKPVGWRTGDVAFRRLSAYVVARPPCVSVALNASGSVTIKAWCGPGDVRPCDTIDEAAKLANRKNSLVHEQNQAGELLKAMLQESLSVTGGSDPRLAAADAAVAAAKAANVVGTVLRAEDMPGHGGRRGMKQPLELVQRSLDVASKQFSVYGLGLRAAFPGADPGQGALLLGSQLHAPPTLRRKVRKLYEEVAEQYGAYGATRVLEELNKLAHSRDLFVEIFDVMDVDIRDHRTLVAKLYGIGSML
jgi:hypothetical protein